MNVPVTREKPCIKEDTELNRYLWQTRWAFRTVIRAAAIHSSFMLMTILFRFWLLAMISGGLLVLNFLSALDEFFSLRRMERMQTALRDLIYEDSRKTTAVDEEQSDFEPEAKTVPSRGAMDIDLYRFLTRAANQSRQVIRQSFWVMVCCLLIILIAALTQSWWWARLSGVVFGTSILTTAFEFVLLHRLEHRLLPFKAIKAEFPKRKRSSVKQGGEERH